VDPSKVRDYLLSVDHPVGAAKAQVFHSAGYQRSEWRTLQRHLLALARTIDVHLATADEYGQAFVGTATLTGPNGRDLHLLTVWFIRSGERMPRFVTAYPWRD
jgi:hypothetical protein